MKQQIAQIGCKPWTLNGLSDRLIVSHHENNYGSAVGDLNAIRDRLGEHDLVSTPAHEIRMLDRVHEWAAELAPDKPVEVYCAYGFNVGCAVAGVLRERGFEARFLRGGLSAWLGVGGARSRPGESRAAAA